MAFNGRFEVNDEYTTRKESWADIKQYIPAGKTIWECFYCPSSKSADYLRELTGSTVIYENIDCFTHNKGDILKSNPPYSMKASVFTRLKLLEKPFIMLVPSGTIQTKYFKNLFGDTKGVQLIIPSKKREFDKVGETKKKSDCAFNTIYICWKINLRQDIIFI